MDQIRKIEKRTKEEIIMLLQKNRLGINKRIRLMDYSIAKRICFEGRFIDCDIYDTQIKWICDYLGI